MVLDVVSSSAKQRSYTHKKKNSPNEKGRQYAVVRGVEAEKVRPLT